MAKNFVAIKTGGIIEIHLPHPNGDYATLCGMDGNDDHPHVDQKTVKVPPGAKVNCDHCRALWDVARRFDKSDFQ